MQAPDIPANWDINLSAWIVQDGNYPDFWVGQTAEFAVEFWVPKEVAPPSRSGGKSANRVGDCLYETVAKIVMQTGEITILDVGFLTFHESSVEFRPTLKRGSEFALQLGLGVDPFFYFERLSRIAEIPPLVYSWKILSILKQTAPFIETVAEDGLLIGRKVLVRDQLRLGYEEILKTDAWNDDEGYAEYTLRCELLPIPPKRVSATAT